MDWNERLSGTPDTGSRTPARRDRDRILYSTEFRRLAGVTQVASATENLLIHNRITHSIKVEQVGTSIVVECDANVRGAGRTPVVDVARRRRPVRRVAVRPVGPGMTTGTREHGR